MDLIETLCNFEDEIVIDTISEIEALLDKKVKADNSDDIKVYISELSAYKGRLVNIESLMYRKLAEKEFEALEREVMTGKSKELRDIQLGEYIKEEKGNYKLVKALREEINNKLMSMQSILKSNDLKIGNRL